MDRTTARRRWSRSAAPYVLIRALGVVSKPLAVFDRDGREIVRNRALERLLGPEGDDGGLLGRMREVARASGRAPARVVHRTALGRFALTGRPLEPGETLDVRAVVVALEPIQGPGRP